MNILAIDTSTMALSCAITSNDKVVAEFSLFSGMTHSERLMPLVDSLLDSAGMEVSDIDIYAATIGPGSFTGLRIGISTVKGLAFASGKLVAPVSSLDALCENISASRYDICPIIDARKGEVFGALYKKEKDGAITSKSEEFNLTPEELIKRTKKKTLFLGDGATLYKDMLSDALKENAVFVTNELNFIRGVNVARLAAAKIKADETVKPETLVPVYVRKSDAELNS